MKKIFLPLLATSAFNATATPYVGLEYGFASVDHSFQPVLEANSVVNGDVLVKTLDPSMDEGMFSGFIGYQLTDKFALELGYSQFTLSDEQGSLPHFTNTDAPNQAFVRENKWDAELESQSFSLVGVLSHPLTNTVTAKAKAGLTYTQYQSSASAYIENENKFDQDLPNTGIVSYPHETHNEFGGLMALGAEFFVMPKLALTANVKYQFDGFANTLSGHLGASYYFK